MICKRCECQITKKMKHTYIDGKHLPIEKGVYCRHCFKARLSEYNADPKNRLVING